MKEKQLRRDSSATAAATARGRGRGRHSATTATRTREGGKKEKSPKQVCVIVICHLILRTIMYQRNSQLQF